MIIATEKFSSKLKPYHFFADWMWKIIVFWPWQVVMDADRNPGLVDISNAPI
jgi:hypothetical protein